MAWFYRYQSKDREFTKVEEPTAKKLEGHKLRVRPLVVGVCGSDLSQLAHNLEEPTVGHEWVGQVLEVGPQVQSLKAGDLVTSVANTACGKCPTCLDGNPEECQRRELLGRGQNSVLSSEIIIEETDLLGAPKGLTPEEVTLLEVAYIGDCSYHRACQLGLKKDHRILIFGAGPIGLFSALSLKLRGHEPVLVEKEKERLELAKSMGFEAHAFAQVMLDSNQLESYDMVIDCTGNNGGPGAIQVVPLFAKKEGAVVIVGKYYESSFPELRFMKRALRVTWVANHSREAFVESMEFWKERICEYSSKVIKTFALESINEAFNEAQERKVMKCMIKLSEES